MSTPPTITTTARIANNITFDSMTNADAKPRYQTIALPFAFAPEQPSASTHNRHLAACLKHLQTQLSSLSCGSLSKCVDSLLTYILIGSGML